MAQGEVSVTVHGNLTADPELRFTPSGAAVAGFTVASTPRHYDRDSGKWVDGDPLFLRCNVWRQMAENVAECLTRGTRVIVTGRLRQRSYDTQDGQKRTVVELEVDEIGPSLKFATAQVRKADRQGERVGQDGIRRDAPPADDPWGRAPAGPHSGYTEEPPFHHHPSMDAFQV